jgi:hypothetical protein
LYNISFLFWERKNFSCGKNRRCTFGATRG